eukprot:365813-Chlamydomonas_euryale.AAC.10
MDACSHACRMLLSALVAACASPWAAVRGQALASGASEATVEYTASILAGDLTARCGFYVLSFSVMCLSSADVYLAPHSVSGRAAHALG